MKFAIRSSISSVNWVQVEGSTKLSYLVTRELYLSRSISRETRNPLAHKYLPTLSTLSRFDGSLISHAL